MTMGLVMGMWLTLLGVLGASRLIIARQPDAKRLIAMVAPYQGWIGAISALWGAWWIVTALLDLRMLSFAPLAWIVWVATGAVMLLLGFVLGVGIFKSFVKDSAANARADELLEKVAPYQSRLGLIAIALGVWDVLRALL
ncbi:MAG TPA: hypothetical protein VF334_10265 [Polyangia bacterium]